MSELEICRLAYEGKFMEFKAKIEANVFEDLSRKKDRSARTALHWACVGSQPEVVLYLHRQHFVNLDMPDESGWTPLMISASVGSYDLVKFLLENDCNPNSGNESQQRPLHYACSKNHPEIARLLLKHGADVNATDKYGATALHRAASKGNLQCVNILLGEYKARVDMIDSEGNTPLYLACEEERVEVVKVLLKHGANPYIKNKQEKTPIDASYGALESLISAPHTNGNAH